MWFSASAPGSLMLLGEYAVLHGKHALVCAIDKRITITLTPRTDDKIKIESHLGSLEINRRHIKPATPFQFVLTVLHLFQKQLPSGCDLRIESAFSEKIGFASSAAVTVATLSVVLRWLQQSIELPQLVVMARTIIRKVQGQGSGADVAACIYGGIVAYRASPFYIEKFDLTYPLTCIYSGNKTPTSVAIKQVQTAFATEPALYKQLCRAIDLCARQGIQSLRTEDWQRLGNLMNVQQGLLDALGVNTPVLADLVYKCRAEEKILGAKISGAGLGDCVIGLGTGIMQDVGGLIPVAMTTQGVFCEQG